MWYKVWDVLFDEYNLCLKADTYGDTLADSLASRFWANSTAIPVFDDAAIVRARAECPHLI